MHIFLNIYGRNMTAVAYNASVAQLEHSLEVFNSGVALTINGFNHKMGVSGTRVGLSSGTFLSV